MRRSTEQRIADILVDQHFEVDVDKVRDAIQAHLVPLEPLQADDF